MIRLKTIFTWDNFHFYALILLVMILSMHYWYVGCVLIVFLYVLRKRLNFILLTLILLSYIGMFIMYLPSESLVDQSFLITDKTNHDTYYTYLVKNGLKTYELNHKSDFQIGDVVYIKGEVECFRKQTSPGGFDSYYYNLGRHIRGRVRVVEIKYQSNIMIFKLKAVDNPFMRLIKDQDILDISVYDFLFTLSSLHLSFIVFLMYKVFYFLDVKNKEKYLLISIILAIFYVIGESILVLSLFIYYALKYINKLFNLSLSAFEIEVVGFIFILIIQPMSIYNYSFIVIYTIVFMNYLKVNQSNLSNLLYTPLILLPFLVIFQGKIDLFMLFLIPLLSLLLKYIYTPVIILVTLIPTLNLIEPLRDFFESIFSFLSVYNFKFYLPVLSVVFIVLYLMLLIYMDLAYTKISYTKRLACVLCLICISYIYTLKPVPDQVIFLDVGQGDSSIIFKNDTVIVVDAYNSVDSYLKHYYVDVIDYLILTHNDLDHMKEAKKLIDIYEVKTLVLSYYQSYDLMHPNTMYIYKDNLIYIEALDLRFLGPIKDYKEPNDNSIVFSIIVSDNKFLFTGDIGVNVEKDLVNTYKEKLDSDILKVPHHGSMTSSSHIFIEAVTPRVGVMSVGYKNMYQLPDIEILNRYQRYGIKVYQTSIDGSILVKDDNYILFPP